MKTPQSFIVQKSAAIVILLLASTGLLFAQGSKFAYQGRLTEAGNPATGTFEMQFKLFDTVDVGTGTQRGDSVTNSAVAASNGVFTVTLDFGAAVFDGSPRFLEIAVKRANTPNPLSLLTPRQAVAPLPYAVHSLSASQLTGDASGNVGIGTTNPAPGVRLEVNGATRVTPGGSGGYLQVGTPNAETGLSVIGSNRLDLRFNGQTATLSTWPGLSPPPPQFGITLNTNGNVGIGMSSPLEASQWKLDIDGATRIHPGVPAGWAIQFSTPNGEPGMTIMGGANRADIRFDNSTLKLVAGFGIGTPSSFNGLAINTVGNVGIGTTDPVNRLSVSGSADFSGSVGIGTTNPIAKLHAAASEVNISAVYGTAAGASGAGVYGNATGRGGIGVYAQSANGPAIHAQGHASQARDKGGFVKAMAYIDPTLPADRYVHLCFNSQPSANVGFESSCGIKMTRLGIGNYDVDFGFPVGDRFISVTLSGPVDAGRAIANPDGNKVNVQIYYYDDALVRVDSAFYILVF